MKNHRLPDMLQWFLLEAKEVTVVATGDAWVQIRGQAYDTKTVHTADE